MEHFADRLAAAVRAKGNAVCVGLDPRWDALPAEIRTRHDDGTLTAIARAYEEFCARVIDVVAPLVAVVKPQSAFFEICGPDGMVVLQRTLRRARQRGLLTIWDGKRNDIADTAAAYADAAFAGFSVGGRTHPVWDADAMTVNPYLGQDAIQPFLDQARANGRGVFILVRTSNRGAGLFQDLDCGGVPLYRRVADAVAGWAGEDLGRCGFGAVGAVVGATYPEELAILRRAHPHVLFLIPGFGAQGGAAAAVAPAFRQDGLGAVVNSARGITYAGSPGERDWEGRVEAAARATIAALADATPMCQLSVSTYRPPAK